MSTAYWECKRCGTNNAPDINVCGCLKLSGIKRLEAAPVEVNKTTGARKFLYWYQETAGGFVTMYGTFLSHEEAVELFKDKHKYGLVSPKISY